MPESDRLVLSYVHLSGFPREDAALQMLKKVASLVKPIMRARKWKVYELAEFYPQEGNLLGLNVNKGKKICLRLRYPGDRSLFLPIEQVIDTMLHELSHIVHGPHNRHFHALWDQLRDELQGLMLKGYTGEGFLSDGHRLGGARLPPHEARRLARAAAEKRHSQPSGTSGGRRLGGAGARPGQDIRRVIAEATERRNKTLQGCGMEQLNETQIHDIADSATRNGFRTQAEEDEANDVAIAEAMWELVQEDEMERQGISYTRPSANRPAGTGHGSATAGGFFGSGGDHSRQTGDQDVAARPKGWACAVCTLQNPPEFLCCEVCQAERPHSASSSRDAEAPARGTSKATGSSRKTANADVVDLTQSPPSKRSRRGDGVLKTSTSAEADGPPVPRTWDCSFCGTRMERKWWTCSVCGSMKDSSR